MGPPLASQWFDMERRAFSSPPSPLLPAPEANPQHLTVPFPLTMRVPTHADLIERFRADRRSLPLHPAEKRLLWILGAHLCFLPWALGTMHAWSQITSLVLAFVGFVAAALPRTYTAEHTDGPAFRLHPWSRLLRFPVFWLGLALLAYIAVQGLNPSWIWERNATHWWLRRVNDIAWLPTSIDTPWERFNLWRQFVIYAAAWLLVCSLWIGITRRRSLQILLTVLVCNGLAIAVAGFAQRATGADFVFDLFRVAPEPTSFGGFIYKNHAGAYLALAAAIACALALWHADRGERAMRKSTPAALLGLGAVALFGTVFFTFSRGASLVIVGTLLLLGAWYLLRRRFARAGAPAANPTVGVAVAVVFLGTLGWTVRQLDYSRIVRGFDPLIREQTMEDSFRSRLLAHEAARRLLADQGLRGVGAGGFRHLFPEYIRQYPEVYANGHLFWEHAHNDWLQISIELGLAGSALLLAGGLWFVAFFVRRGSQWHSLAVPLLLGCLQTLVHAWMDFPLQCPAILATWLAQLVIAARWTELEAAAGPLSRGAAGIPARAP